MDIKILSSEVVDQIAAGEVVERPSHLLKELMENSLDAGATQIEVDVDEGGKKIRVSDNGKGIHFEDLSLVCARHATSKISDADDLWKLHTFGFRGEALASISSVSRLKITSRRHEATQAYALENHFGKEQKPFPAGREPGTTVEVEELFSNVPARLKFLKSDSAEITQIKSVVKALALANPAVEFKLKQQGKILLFFPFVPDLLSRAKNVLDIKDVFYVQREYQGYRLEMVYSSPQTTTGNSKQIWIFVQNRWVADRTIQAALMESYRSLLMHGEYPFVVIKLHVPESTVDVNIHPTKSQVKFVDSSQIFKQSSKQLLGLRLSIKNKQILFHPQPQAKSQNRKGLRFIKKTIRLLFRRRIIICAFLRLVFPKLSISKKISRSKPFTKRQLLCRKRNSRFRLSQMSVCPN
jgi:DNA mismatch repair protein MutL